MKKSNNIISDWLDKFGDPEIDKKVEMELEEMIKERHYQIIDEVYKNYLNEWTFEKYPNDGSVYSVEPIKVKEHSKEQFVYRCKTDTEFSERWGLKIEERKLGAQERNEWFQIHLNGNNPFMKSDWKDFELDQQNIPTKLITIIYNNVKIKSYE
jgi:hypothetical protein